MFSTPFIRYPINPGGKICLTSTASIESQLSSTIRQQLLALGQELGPENNKGEIYEFRFESALERLVQGGVIAGWEKTIQNSEDDRKGIDFWLIVNYRRIPFSICGRLNNLTGRDRNRKIAKHKRYRVLHVDIRSEEGGLKTVEDLIIELTSILHNM